MTQPSETNSSPTLIIGVGNIYRGDDAVGISLVRHLKELDIHGVELLEHSGEGADLMEILKGYPSVFLVDAVQSGAPPGKILRFEANAEPLPSHFSTGSTHSYGVAEAIEMARLLDELPQRLIVFGIEGKNFETGTHLSHEVEAAIPTLVVTILQELQS